MLFNKTHNKAPEGERVWVKAKDGTPNQISTEPGEDVFLKDQQDDDQHQIVGSDNDEPPPLSPVNKWLLETFCQSDADREEVLAAFNAEMASPGMKRNSLQGRNAVMFVFMVGIVRQPVIFLFGPIVAPFAYAFAVYSFLR